MSHISFYFNFFVSLVKPPLGTKFLDANPMDENDEDDENETSEVDEPPPAKKTKTKMEKEEEDGEEMDIEAQLSRMEKERHNKEILCGICNNATRINTRADGEPFLSCTQGCRFPWSTIKQAGQIHVAARHTLEDRFRPNLGGSIPRCPRHRELAALMLVTKAVNDETAPIKGHLFFTCIKPQKEGGPCTFQKTGRWSVVADVAGEGEKAKKFRKQLENKFALDAAYRKKRQEEAKNTASNAFAECEKDFKFGTGVFGEHDDADFYE